MTKIWKIGSGGVGRTGDDGTIALVGGILDALETRRPTIFMIAIVTEFATAVGRAVRWLSSCGLTEAVGRFWWRFMTSGVFRLFLSFGQFWNFFEFGALQ